MPTATSMATAEVAAKQIADTVYEAYCAYQDAFAAATARAPALFVARDWAAASRNGIVRLAFYPKAVDSVVARLRPAHGGPAQRQAWQRAKAAYAALRFARDDDALGQSFFNSVSRRVYEVVGKAPDIEFTDALELGGDNPRVYRSFRPQEVSPQSTASLVRQILVRYALDAPFAGLDADCALVGERIDAWLAERFDARPIDRIEVLTPLLFRNKAAYLVGRIRCGDLMIPLALALLHPAAGVTVDAVLLTQRAARVLFSFTRSPMQAQIAAYAPTLSFLLSLMPSKPMAELYMAIGHDKHGKTELYRDIIRHLAQTQDRFVRAPGKAGMVMLVFTLPSYEVVLKVIKDRFDPPKRTTRQHVMSRYDLVFQHDRVGRLIDAQQFELLQLERERFDPQLLAELQRDASEAVCVQGDQVVLKHLYIERRITPLDVFFGQADADSARDAVIDYGYAIKDLAAANIFPGDIFLKNFGVTRHGRVVFYDYDELCLLQQCRFRRIPPPRSLEDEMSARPWFAVGDNDIFPEELPRFLALQGDLRQAFMEHHRDLFDVDFWHAMQQRHQQGDLPDVYPYKSSERLRP